MAGHITRRRFVQTSTAATTAAIAGGVWSELPAAESTSPNEKLNIGIIGVNHRGRANTNGVRSENIAALCDVDANYLDAAKKERICTLISVGISRRQAAAYVGCHHATITRSARRDAEFAAALWEAEAYSEVEPLSRIVNAGKRSWRAAAWLLERKFPERYSKIESLRVRQPDSDLIEQRKKEQALDGLSNEELQRIFFDEM